VNQKSKKNEGFWTQLTWVITCPIVWPWVLRMIICPEAVFDRKRSNVTVSSILFSLRKYQKPKWSVALYLQCSSPGLIFQYPEWCEAPSSRIKGIYSSLKEPTSNPSLRITITTVHPSVTLKTLKGCQHSHLAFSVRYHVPPYFLHLQRHWGLNSNYYTG
jgi:hypothetical protein